MAYKDKRSRPGLYYGTDNLIYDKKTKQWIEDPKTFTNKSRLLASNKTKKKKKK